MYLNVENMVLYYDLKDVFCFVVCMSSAKVPRTKAFLNLYIEGASVLHLRPSPNHNLDKASQRMTCLSMHLALSRVVSCHTEIGPKLSAVE
jgi:hypothetical protein